MHICPTGYIENFRSIGVRIISFLLHRIAYFKIDPKEKVYFENNLEEGTVEAIAKIAYFFIQFMIKKTLQFRKFYLLLYFFRV